MPASSEPLTTDTKLTLAPVQPAQRIEIIDILRGWALFGVVVVNFSNDLPWSELFADQSPTSADGLAFHLIQLFAQEKFYSLFSFLFGLGFVIQMERAKAKGSGFVALFSRRLVVLFLFGCVQFMIQGAGGAQLIIYATLGFLFLPLRRCSTTTILVTAFVCVLAFSVAMGTAAGLRRESTDSADGTESQAPSTKVHEEPWFRIHSQGSFSEILILHKQQLIRRLSTPFPYLASLGMEFPLMLLGFYIGRRGMFESIPENILFIRKTWWWGLGLGVGSCISYGVWQLVGLQAPFWAIILLSLMWFVGAPALGFFYACTIVLLAEREAWKKRMAPLVAVGRLTLSNYLFQSVIHAGLFFSYGLGLYGKVGPVGGLAIAVVVFTIQILLSMWWIRRFRFGPAEWLWRSLTYGQLQPMHVQQRGN